MGQKNRQKSYVSLLSHPASHSGEIISHQTWSILTKLSVSLLCPNQMTFFLAPCSVA